MSHRTKLPQQAIIIASTGDQHGQRNTGGMFGRFSDIVFNLDLQVCDVFVIKNKVGLRAIGPNACLTLRGHLPLCSRNGAIPDLNRDRSFDASVDVTDAC